jgi:hypothetical protein
VSFLSASITDYPRLIGTHTTCRVRFGRVCRVRHTTAGLAVGFTSLCDGRDVISLHVAVNWFRVVGRFVIRVRDSMRSFASKHEVVDPRTTAEISIKRFDLAAIGNLLGEFVDAEMIREVPNRESAITVVVVVTLRALNGDDKRFHDFHQVAGRDSF